MLSLFLVADLLCSRAHIVNELGSPRSQGEAGCPMKPAMRAVGIFFVALVAGCAEVGKPQPSPLAQSEPRKSEPQASKPQISKPQVSEPQVSESQVLVPPVTAPPAVAPHANAPAKGSVPAVAVQPQ